MQRTDFRLRGRLSCWLGMICLIWLVGGRCAAALAIEPIPFTQETLDNGLRVIYAPLHQTPVVEVRVLYHVGSRDERADRQGFAHMFEHMMFRGSAHLGPLEHAKWIGLVGGNCNAFTSFDQTVYHESLPSNQLELALWLEADRMASFKVSADIFKTERKVVAEEWRMGQNKPYGTMFQEFLRVSFQKSPYSWSPIGNMDHLRAAQVTELQDFFNTYYLPNNAVLSIAGDIDGATAQKWVHKYFGWIPRGPDVRRDIPIEPPQTEARHKVIPAMVPLTAIMIGYHTPPFADDDHYALDLLSTILGGGRSSRLERLLVTGANPKCVNAGAGDMTLQDQGIFTVSAHLLSGKDAQEVENDLAAAIADVVKNGVTQEELDKAKVQAKVGIIHARATAEMLAAELGSEALFANDANRVNTELQKADAVTLDQIKAVAGKYLNPQQATTLYFKPDPLGIDARATQAKAQDVKEAPVAPSTREVAPRAVAFPADYPVKPMLQPLATAPQFQKGSEVQVGPVRVIVMTDHRLPTVNWSLMMPYGSHSDPAGKEGLGSFVAGLLRRGTTQQDGSQLSIDLESHGITLSVSDAGDHSVLTGDCTTDQLDHAIERSRQVLLTPRFDPADFANLKQQTLSNLLQSQESPATVAGHELSGALFGTTVQGRYATPASVATITLDDVKGFYGTYYHPEGAVLILSGDVDLARGKELAGKLLEGWAPASPAPAAVDYSQPFPPVHRRVILVDRPDARGCAIRIGIPAYDIHDQQKFAGSMMGQVLSAGFDGRLMQYVRAEKGLVYGVYGVFRAERHGGEFIVDTDCDPAKAVDAIDAIFKVLEGAVSADVTPEELANAKLRVAGSMVMSMQTIQQQAGIRLDGILNGYAADYYDKYSSRVAAVTTEQTRKVMEQYVKLGEMTIVVVAPAEALKEPLSKFGPVEVIHMPSKRAGAVGGSGLPELLHPATGPTTQNQPPR